MRALNRKLVRELGRMRGQTVTIAIVVACGVAALIAALGTYRTLIAARDEFYAQTHFAQLFATLKRAPESLVSRLVRIDGVAGLETRLVFNATLDIPGEPAPVVGRLISLPMVGVPSINRLTLRLGRLPDPSRTDEVIVGEGFARARNVGIGYRFSALLNGRRQSLQIVGIAISPEYIYATPSSAALPDDRRFGVFWMGRRALEAAFDMDGAFNDVVVRLAPGASLPAAIRAIDLILAPYGGIGAYGRDEQTSNRFVGDEIAEQGVMATTIPVIFLGVAAFLINIVLGRMIGAQREQIAGLKALGYPDSRIAGHYFGFALIVVMAGVAVGVVLGIAFGRVMTDSYQPYFRFPDLRFRFEIWIAAAAGAASIGAGLLGAAGALRRILRMAPAEAMRPPAPARFSLTWAERAGLTRPLPARFAFVMRSLIGRPWRFALGAGAIALSVPLVVIAFFWSDAIDFMVDLQFSRAERANVLVAFVDPLNPSVLRELARLPGVREVEGIRAASATLRAGTRSHRTAIEGIGAEARLRRPLDVNLNPIEVTQGGLFLTDRLAAKLAVKPGDRVTIEIREGTRPVRELIVTGTTRDILGVAARMENIALLRLLGEGPSLSGAALLVDPAQSDALYARLKSMPKIAAVTIKREAMKAFMETAMSLIVTFSLILTAFAAAITIGVVYNNARIGLAERGWELATLRVLGFTRTEVSLMFFAELGVSLVIAIPAGLVLAYWLVVAIVSGAQSESFWIPPVIEASTYALAGLVIAVAGAASAVVVTRRIRQLDLVAVLKTRD
ncbi:MAG: ABC transporter permease [Alphaproteobacteria bacterium]